MKLIVKQSIENNKEFQNIVSELIENDTVQKMKDYRQHYDTTCFDHCYLVSYYCYLVCKRYNLDYVSATRAGMLHDLFLYDWRLPNHEGLHAFTHGKTACKNACKIFDLNDKEKNMIVNHMWPVTLAFPSSFEGFVLTLVDKYCAISESAEVLKARLLSKKFIRRIYDFFSFS